MWTCVFVRTQIVWKKVNPGFVQVRELILPLRKVMIKKEALGSHTCSLHTLCSLITKLWYHTPLYDTRIFSSVPSNWAGITMTRRPWLSHAHMNFLKRHLLRCFFFTIRDSFSKELVRVWNSAFAFSDLWSRRKTALLRTLHVPKRSILRCWCTRPHVATHGACISDFTLMTTHVFRCGAFSTCFPTKIHALDYSIITFRTIFSLSLILSINLHTVTKQNVWHTNVPRFGRIHVFGRQLESFVGIHKMFRVIICQHMMTTMFLWFVCVGTKHDISTWKGWSYKIIISMCNAAWKYVSVCCAYRALLHPTMKIAKGYLHSIFGQTYLLHDKICKGGKVWNVFHCGCVCVGRVYRFIVHETICEWGSHHKETCSLVNPRLILHLLPIEDHNVRPDFITPSVSCHVSPRTPVDDLGAAVCWSPPKTMQLSGVTVFTKWRSSRRISSCLLCDILRGLRSSQSLRSSLEPTLLTLPWLPHLDVCACYSYSYSSRTSWKAHKITREVRVFALRVGGGWTGDSSQEAHVFFLSFFPPFRLPAITCRIWVCVCVCRKPNRQECNCKWHRKYNAIECVWFKNQWRLCLI